MSFLSKIVPTFFSAVNENTLALASLKFDFSLIKVEAPLEFNPVGSALTKARKTQAEDGAPHRTARRLGALFEQLVPSTPKLISAYGRRVSQIVNQPGVNPEGLNSHGPFKDFVGVDATGIWAAATSGISAISMYMLACIIAQLLDEKGAISLWTELVSERKKQILQQASQNGLTSEHTLHSVQQDISREELALWDSAARSWLRSADEAMYSKKKQLQLMIENLHIPHHSGDGTYAKVTGMWQEAMKGVESLLEGRPQEAQNKAVPLALLAWHLYPNLIVLTDTTKHVPFDDILFPPAAMLTLGALTHNSQPSVGSKWSLALSQYQYYGGAINVESQEDSSRVTIDQALIIILGARMARWNISARGIEDMQQIAAWFKALFFTLAHPTQSLEDWDEGDEFAWLKPLIKSGLLICDTTSKDILKDYFQLYRFGQRKSARFLKAAGSGPPFFGLRTPILLDSLAMPDIREAQIQYFRDIAKELASDNTEFIIIKDSLERCELITALPWLVDGHKRGNDGDPKPELRHIRWKSGSKSRSPVEPLSKSKRINKLSFSTCFHPEPEATALDATRYGSMVLTLGKASMGEIFGSWVGVKDLPDSIKKNAFEHESDYLRDERHFRASWQLDGQDSITNIYSHIVGNEKFGLYVRRAANRALPDLARCIANLRRQSVPDAESQALLRKCNSLVLTQYLQHLVGLEQIYVGVTFTEVFRAKRLAVESFIAVFIIWSVYRHLPQATISTKIFTSGQALEKAAWIKGSVSAMTNIFSPYIGLSSEHRMLALACVIYMDSGGIDIETKHLSEAFAVCRENCMYVINPVLSDPFKRRAESGLKLTRLVGNLGWSGTSVLIGPKEPRIRDATADYRVVNHAIYDGLREDNFKGTSLHLQFTGWKLPIPISGKVDHTIDYEVHYLESVIKVRDRGQWVADLNILRGIQLQTSAIDWIKYCSCSSSHPRGSSSHNVSLDNWDELLDPPLDAVAIFRAHGNWAARLAAASILGRKGKMNRTLFVGPKKCCLECIDRRLKSVACEPGDTIYLID